MDKRSKHSLASQRSVRGHVGSLAGSRAGSRLGSVVSSSMAVHSRFMPSRQSQFGSKSNLLTASKSRLTSDSMRFQKPAAQILDENGMDVTPHNLLQQGGVQPRKKVQLVGSDTTHGPSETTFGYSIYGTMAALTAGGTALATQMQPFSKSMFGAGSVLDIGETEVEELFRRTSEKPMETFSQVSSFPKDKPERLTEEDLEKEVEITLTETETIWILDIPGTCVPMDAEGAEDVKKSNEKYSELVKSRPGNDRYADREMQTIDNAPKVKQIQTDPVLRSEMGVNASTWDMHDTYEALNQAESDKAKGEEETFEELSSRAASRLTSKGTSRVTSRAPTAMGVLSTIASAEVEGSSALAGTMLNASVLTDLTLYSASAISEKEKERVDPTKPNDHPILKLESLKDSLRVVERAVTQNYFQPKQALYRDFPVLHNPDHQPTVSESIVIHSPHLEKLWTYNCPLTKKRIVTCLAWNPVNKDIVAVGYGTFTAKSPTQGLICCWSLKNPEYPERIFHAPAGITSLGFSNLHPNLLAAGLFNGEMCIYNARSTAHESVLSSREALHRHSAPVWQVSWVVKEHYMGENRAEVLVSASVDGKILQWAVRKGFESTLLMKLKRMVTPKSHDKKSSKSKHNHRGGSKVGPGTTVGQGEAYISQHAPGMGFDFSQKDPNVYLACTEEGFIHKCSCSYNEQVLETYTGHNGPVYRVRWSPFVPDVFLSCSADWTVKLWHQELASPLHTFGNSQKSIYDVCWSPFNSTLFGCVSEGQIEVWCLEHSMLDPLIVQRPISGAQQTCIAFAHTTKVVLVGDSEGTVSVYLLRNVPTAPDDQAGALLSAVNYSSMVDLPTAS